MKKFFTTLIHKPIYLILLFILIVFLPIGISAPPEGIDRQHISTIGIDLVENGIEVSVLSHVSNQSQNYTRTYVLNSAIAQNIPDALYKISAITGRKAALTHTTAIVVSEELAKQNMQQYLDYFYRNDNAQNDTLLLCVRGKAKDLLSFEKERINSTGYSIEEVLVYNAKNTFFIDNNIESFYKGLFSPTKTSLTAIAELNTNEDNEQLLSSADSGSDDSTAGKAKQKLKSIENIGIYKNGILKDILTPNEMLGFNIIKGHARNIFFEIENFSDEIFDNVKIIFNIRQNKVSINGKFENEKPIIEINLLMSLSIDSVITNNVEKKYYTKDIKFLSTKIKTEIANKLKSEFKKFLEKIFETNSDLIGAYTTLNNSHKEEFEKWLEKNDNRNNFLSQIEYRMIVNPILTT